MEILQKGKLSTTPEAGVLDWIGTKNAARWLTAFFRPASPRDPNPCIFKGSQVDALPWPAPDDEPAEASGTIACRDGDIRFRGSNAAALWLVQAMAPTIPNRPNPVTINAPGG